MAVVEVGRTVRAGYIGDTRCTRHFSSLWLPDAPDKTTFSSMLTEAEEARGAGAERLWTLETESDANVNHLERIVSGGLQCSTEDCLVLVVPEVWHEQFDVMRRLVSAVLESGFISALYCLRPSVAWTLGSGRCSAVMMDVGYNHATTTAVLDGYALRNTVVSSGVAGAAVTRHLRSMIEAEQLQSLDCVSRFKVRSVQELVIDDVVDCIKQAACVVRSEKAGAESQSEPLMLRAPDGSSITVEARAKTEPYELLFRRSSSSSTDLSLAHALAGCARSLDPEWRCQSVPHLLCGGTTRATGFQQRLLTEAQHEDSYYFRYEKEGTFQVSSNTDGCWIGASLVADSAAFSSLWVTRAEMEEEGYSALHRKLFY
uniref:Uncharacterized protein TCIL3000_4_610 n=1 Tax=Trypanosoma congolense (strain IL3000) TaxID=1068625 RepID=G0UKS2_TRYCI|nr:unnamed protein product [Trypanosoma congolense IL3000]